MIQIYAMLCPGDRLYPARREQYRTAQKPISRLHVQIADVPRLFVHNEVLQIPNFAVLSLHLVALYILRAEQVRLFVRLNGNSRPTGGSGGGNSEFRFVQKGDHP